MINKEWLCGFINGEGCFTFAWSSSCPVFQITLSIRDKQILYDIKDFLKLGRVNKCKEDFSCLYIISKIDDCLKLIEVVDGNIYGDKLVDYENWKLGIKLLMSCPRPRTKKHLEFINKLKPRQNRERIIFTEKDFTRFISI